MNLGWIRHLFTLSEIEKGRIRETHPDPRRIEGFQDIESLIGQSLTPAPTVNAQTASPPILTEEALPRTGARGTLARSLPDQDLLKKLLKHRPHYSSNRILRAETAATIGVNLDVRPGEPEGTS